MRHRREQGTRRRTMRTRLLARAPSTIVAAGPTLVVVVLCVLASLPLAWMVQASLMSPADLLGGRLRPLATNPRWSNYVEIWNHVDLGRMLVNSLVAATIVVVGQLVTSTANGLLLARSRFWGRWLVVGIFIAGLAVPDVLTWIPSFRVLHALRFIDTFAALTVPFVAGGLGTFVMLKHFASVPRDVEDAARIDGCSEFGLLIRILLPMAAPGLRVVALIAFLYSWGSLAWPLLMTHDPALRTLPIGLSLMHDELTSAWNLVMATAVVATVPPMVVTAWLARRLFQQGGSLSH